MEETGRFKGLCLDKGTIGAYYKSKCDDLRRTPLENRCRFCDKCNRLERFIFHGNYNKTVVYAADEDECTVEIEMQRIKCKGCGATSTLWFDIILPYIRRTLASILFCVAAYLLDHQSALDAANEALIATSTFYLYLRLFKTYQQSWLIRMRDVLPDDADTPEGFCRFWAYAKDLPALFDQYRERCAEDA